MVTRILVVVSLILREVSRVGVGRKGRSLVVHGIDVVIEDSVEGRLVGPAVVRLLVHGAAVVNALGRIRGRRVASLVGRSRCR